MSISFGYLESRSRLEVDGFVYTLRLLRRKRVGACWYNYKRGTEKQGYVYIEFIGNFINRDNELEIYVVDSGFNSLREWLKKAKKSRYLYKVILLKFYCNDCGNQCKKQVLISGKFYGVYLNIKKNGKTVWVRRSCPDINKKDIGGLI